MALVRVTRGLARLWVCVTKVPMPRPVRRHGGFLREDLNDFLSYDRVGRILRTLDWPLDSRVHFSAREVWMILAWHHFLRGNGRELNKLPEGLWSPGDREERPPPPPPPMPHDQSPTKEAVEPEEPVESVSIADRVIDANFNETTFTISARGDRLRRNYRGKR